MAKSQFQSIGATRRVDIAKMQTAQTIRINTKETATKILSCGIDSTINSYECQKDEASFFGRTNIRLLFVDETGTINSANYNADFTDRLMSDDISSDTQLQFDVVVADYKTDLNQNLVTIQAVLEVSASAFVYSEMPCLVPCDEIFTKSTDVELVTSVHTLGLNAEISEELQASANINRILLAESSVSVFDHNILDGVLTVSGEAVVNLLYVSGDEIMHDKLPFKFSTEVEAKSLDQSNQLALSATVKNTKIRLDILEDEVNNAFTADIALQFQCMATVIGQKSIVEDAYTTDSDLTFTRNSLLTTLPCGSAAAKKTIEQTVPFSQKGDFVAATNLKVVVTKCTSLEREAAIEGVFCGNILFKTEEGFESTAIELPFSEVIDIDFIMPSCRSSAKATVADVSVKLGATVTVTADLNFVVESSRTSALSVISETIEEPIQKGLSHAIEVCLARKGETLWQLAKGLHISEQDILTINPDIASPLEQDTKIVIYNAL